MRILTIGNLYPPHALGGGYEVTWRSSVEHQRAAGNDVRVLTTDHRSPDASGPESPDVHRELRWYWRDHLFPRLSLRERVQLEQHNGKVLDRQLAHFRPDVIAWWAMGGMSLALIERVRRAGVPAIGVVGDDWMTYGPWVDGWQKIVRSPPAIPMRGILERATGIPSRVDLGRAGAWLFNSETVRAQSIRAVGPLCDARVVHPGVDHGLFHPAPERPWRWRLLCLGRVDERKGVEVALDTLPLLPAEARLSIVGRGEESYLARLRERAERDGTAPRVELRAAPRERVPAEYADADVLLFPVRWNEPWGMVPLEAMATGTLVIATATGGAREYLSDGENCLLVENPPAPDALREAIARLAGDPALRGRLRRAGVETARRYDERGYNEAILRAVEEAPSWDAC